MPVKPPPEMHDLQESIDGLMALRAWATRQTEGCVCVGYVTVGAWHHCQKRSLYSAGRQVCRLGSAWPSLSQSQMFAADHAIFSFIQLAMQPFVRFFVYSMYSIMYYLYTKSNQWSWSMSPPACDTKASHLVDSAFRCSAFGLPSRTGELATWRHLPNWIRLYPYKFLKDRCTRYTYRKIFIVQIETI